MRQHDSKVIERYTAAGYRKKGRSAGNRQYLAKSRDNTSSVC